MKSLRSSLDFIINFTYFRFKFNELFCSWHEGILELIY